MTVSRNEFRLGGLAHFNIQSPAIDDSDCDRAWPGLKHDEMHNKRYKVVA